MERLVDGWSEHQGGAYGYADVEDTQIDAMTIEPVLCDRAISMELTRSAAQALIESEERYRYTIALSPLIAWTADPLGGIVEVDERGLASMGLSLEQARGQGFFTAVHPRDRQTIATMWRRNATLGQPTDNHVRMRMRDGSYRWHRSRAAPRRDAAGKILRWYGTIEDVHERKLAGDAIRWAAEHDGLTGVWVRAAFFAAFEEALLKASKAQSKVALLLLDLDDFKQINDQFGHQMGDTLLKEVASRLGGSADQSTMVGRLGGDEFALFLARPSSPELLVAIDEAIAALEVPFHHDENTHRCRGSVGVALYPADGADSETLRENADLALYDAKAQGGGVIRYFRGELRLRMQQRLSMLSIARDALDRDLILPYYQPKVDLRTDRIIGFEALLRWKHVGRGVQSPASIAAAFDDPTLAVALGDRMHAKVLADIRDWLNAGVAFGRIAINAAAAEFNRPDFAARFLARLAAADVPPTCIELEITESVILSNRGDHVSRLITQLRAAGVTIALDDFGTGYASLAHLKEYPVDVLKIDRSFVSTLSNCDGAIVRAIIGLGQALDIRTVAEGVETTAQSDTLLRLGCDLGQGYLFSTPIEAGAVAGLIAAHPGHVARERRVGAERRGKRLKSA
jgi:diguanylate cyclase (GGDEF)-like protein/PAS domain S-box-containing protein